MERETPLQELRALFETDTADVARMRRLATIITLPLLDLEEARALRRDIDAAISLFQNVPEDGRSAFDMLEHRLSSLL